MKKILLGLTTTLGSDYLGKIEELKKFNITEIAFFPTAINQKKRKEIYALLEKSPVKNIPHVHLRDDMEEWELEYLRGRFAVEAFNIHDKNNIHPFAGVFDRFQKFSKNIYIENCEEVPKKKELSQGGGLCVDFSHWQDFIMLETEGYNKQMLDAIGAFRIGCSHISAIGDELTASRDAVFPEIIYRNYSKHFFDKLSEFDYIKNFLRYLPELISLELENSFEDQLKTKAYLEEMISLGKN